MITWSTNTQYSVKVLNSEQVKLEHSDNIMDLMWYFMISKCVCFSCLLNEFYVIFYRCITPKSWQCCLYTIFIYTVNVNKAVDSLIHHIVQNIKFAKLVHVYHSSTFHQTFSQISQIKTATKQQNREKNIILLICTSRQTFLLYLYSWYSWYTGACTVT